MKHTGLRKKNGDKISLGDRKLNQLPLLVQAFFYFLKLELGGLILDSYNNIIYIIYEASYIYMYI